MTSKIRTLFKAARMIDNFPTYLMDYFKLIRKKNIIYKLKNGIRYKVRPKTTDRFIINEIWIHKIYNPPGFEINKNDLVVDIGGHIGIFTILAAKKANRGKVYVFEPSPENFELLVENVKLNNASNVYAVNKAVSNKSEKKKLFISQGSNKGSTSFYKNEDSGQETEVQALSFKKLIKKLNSKINFLKIDCEGTEYDILFNIGKPILNKIEKISMEYHYINKDRNGNAMKSFLESTGFVVKKTGEKLGMIYAKKNRDFS